ncbi:MAG: hypothetical protein H8D92_00940 [Pelagibacteraceae bacterium]|nr:hypothetical protein [Pelagibacteraceae bacterium]
MTTTNVQTRQPSVMDYASPVQFRFKCSKLPKVEFFCQSANIPGIGLGVASIDTPLKSIPFPGDEVTYQDLAISFLVDENLQNYKEIHDWIIGLGAPQNHTQFSDLRGLSSDRFPGTSSSNAITGQATADPLPEGGMYSDATLTILNSKNIAVTEIRFHNIFPTSLGALSYDVKASDVDYLAAGVDFSYMYYEIVQL